MNIWSRLKDVGLQNNIEVETLLGDEVVHMLKVDINLLNKVHVDVTAFKVEHEEEDELCAHMIVSRMITQIALNRHNNDHYYRHNVCYNERPLKNIQDEDARNKYKELLKPLLQKECCKKSLLEIIRRSMMIYLITCNVLRRMENSKDSSRIYGNQEKDHKLADHCDEDLKSDLKGTAAVICSYNKDLLVEQWTCSKCTMLNVFEDELCKACEEYGPHYNKWRCRQCTMINDKLEEICHACNKWSPFMNICGKCRLNYINVTQEKVCSKCILLTARKYNCEIGIDSSKEVFDKNLNEKLETELLNDEKWASSKRSSFNSVSDSKCSCCTGPHYNTLWCTNGNINRPRSKSKCNSCRVS